MNFIKSLWLSIKSNPIFVAASSAFVGAAVSAIQDELASGKIDWTRAGLNKLFGYAITAGIASLVHLYRPQPNPTVPAVIPPSTQVVEVPAKLEPVDPKAIPTTTEVKP